MLKVFYSALEPIFKGLEKEGFEKNGFFKKTFFFFRGRTKSLSREKRAEKRGREGQEKEHKRKQREDRANTTAPAGWNSTPIPGENARACRKHAYRPGRPSALKSPGSLIHTSTASATGKTHADTSKSGSNDSEMELWRATESRLHQRRV